MKQLLGVSRALYFLVILIAFSSCSNDTPSTTPVGGQLATRTFRIHRRTGDSVYQKTFAIFYNTANPKLSLRATNTTLNGASLPYDVTMSTEQYHLDSVLPSATSYKWHVDGQNGIPTYDLNVLAPDSIVMTGIYSGDSAAVGTVLSVQWTPAVPSDTVTVELDQGAFVLSTQTLVDHGSAQINLASAQPGVVSVYVYKINDAHSTVLGKLYDMTGEYYAFDTLFVK